MIPGPPAAGAPALARLEGRVTCVYPDVDGLLWRIDRAGGRWGAPTGERPGRTVRGVALAPWRGRLHALTVDAAGELWLCTWIGAGMTADRVGEADPDATPALAARAGQLAAAYKARDAAELRFLPLPGGAAQRIAGAAVDAGPALLASDDGWICAFRALPGRRGEATWRIGQALAAALCDAQGWATPLAVAGPAGAPPALARLGEEVACVWPDPEGLLHYVPILTDAWPESQVIPEATTRRGAALVADDDELVCAWVGEDGQLRCSVGARR